MRIIKSIVDTLNQCPEYIGKGIIQLLVITVGGFMVAWITTRVFGRKSEINAVEGALLKRKLDIYEELYGKLEALKAEVVIPSDLTEAAIKALKAENVLFNPINSSQILGVFDSPQCLTNEFLSIDSYIVTKRLYFDNDVLIQTMRFQNYFGLFRRLLVMFEEQFVDTGVPLDKKEVADAERLLTVELGIMLQDELVNQIDKVGATMKQCFQNLSFEHHDQIEYNYDYYNSPEGPVMKEFVNTRLFVEKDKITKIVSNAVSLGMAICAQAGKTK